MTIEIVLPLNKSYLSYPLVYLLGQKVDALGIATVEAKLAAIT